MLSRKSCLITHDKYKQLSRSNAINQLGFFWFFNKKFIPDIIPVVLADRKPQEQPHLATLKTKINSLGFIFEFPF